MGQPLQASLTMFYTEGNPIALVVENRKGNRIEKELTLDTAEAALAWCKKHGAMLVYLPFDPTRN